eukprot:gene11751-24639_t
MVHLSYITSSLLFTCLLHLGKGIGRTTTKIEIPRVSPGTSRYFLQHKWGPSEGPTVYIQASLHADEIPGMLVANHLIKAIDAADALGDVLQQIVIVPFANPIGLSQQVLDTHLGRFSLDTSINFNRKWPDLTSGVARRVEQTLCSDVATNVALIRTSILDELDTIQIDKLKEDAALKVFLMRLSATADIVLDLHCDSDAIVHMYTLDGLWPTLTDLAADIGSHCHLVAPASGGNPFDEVLSGLWANLAAMYPSHPIPIACQAATIELRGESE